MTIYEIKRRTAQSSPFFFDRKSMRFFGQTLADFRVRKHAPGVYHISAPIKDRTRGRNMGTTERYFIESTNELKTKI